MFKKLSPSISKFLLLCMFLSLTLGHVGFASDSEIGIGSSSSVADKFKIIRTAPVLVKGAKNNNQETTRLIHKADQNAQKRFVLSLSGGGVRGSLTVPVIAAIYNAILTNLEDDYDISDAEITDFFDLMAGTSIGGILACAMNTPSKNDPDRLYNMEEMRDIFRVEGGRIFPNGVGQSLRNIGTLGSLRRPKYSRDGIDDVLNEYFLQHYITNASTNMFVTTVDTGNYSMRRIHSWTTNEERKYFMHEAAACTSAAPTIFRTKEVNRPGVTLLRGADGGTVANNPSELAAAKARALFPGDECVLISIGTGTEAGRIPWNLIRFGGAAHWVFPLISSILNITEDVNHNNMEEISGLHIKKTQTVETISMSFLDALALVLGQYKHEEELLLEKETVQKFYREARSKVRFLAAEYDQNPDEILTVRARYNGICKKIIKDASNVLKETTHVNMAARATFREWMTEKSVDLFKLRSDGLDNIDLLPSYFRFQAILENATMDDIDEIPALEQAGAQLAQDRDEDIQLIAKMIAEEFRHRQAWLRAKQEASESDEDL